MTDKTKIVCVVGTRPEAIKMAPVIAALKQQAWAEVITVATAQHRGMLDQVLDFFDIEADVDLDIMRPGQSLAGLTSRLMSELDGVFGAAHPQAVLVQGDTTSAMTASLASFYRQIPVGHVEAGLRTGDVSSPFPEEANRTITGKLARWHFAPTAAARQNLLAEGVPPSHITVSGNTVIDALLATAAKEVPLAVALTPDRKLVLVTIHRRENFGEPFASICEGVAQLASRNPHITILYPVHPNPNVRAAAYEKLGRCENVKLCDPLEYPQFVAAMKRASFIISDSGGVQEEAPALGVPVLVLREKTERPEAVECGLVMLVGHDAELICQQAQRLLDDDAAHAAMVGSVSPYGDGRASARIIGVLGRHFHA